MKAYDLEMLHHAPERGTSANHGWVFGLPPGIAPEHWPLDPVTGYPLMHGFTLLLPEDHRCHGPEIVALSFFATPADQNDGGADPKKKLRRAVLGKKDRPEEADLAFFWDRAQSQHSRLHRMRDILDYEYAVILLTQAEFDGALCQPPELPENAYLIPQALPGWLDIGSAAAFYGEPETNPIVTEEDHYIYKMLGGRPEKRIDFARAIAYIPRKDDPNAGIAPQDVYDDEPAENGYQNFYYWKGGVVEVENYTLRDWAADHKDNHIGGTMRPVQATPEFSPHYIGFEEYFGGYNFGTGNAQLDFQKMEFDWACG